MVNKIFWQEIDSHKPFQFGKQSTESVELTLGSAYVHTLLPAKRSAASRSGHPAMSECRVGLADQQARGSTVGIQEMGCREQVIGSCRGFGVFAAAADKAGQGGVELWIRQDIMGNRRSFHVQVAVPRFLLVKGHTAAGVIQFCVCQGPDSTRGETEIKAWWRRSAAHLWSACQASLPLVVLCDANARVGSIASQATGDQASDWEEAAGAEFLTLLLDLCLPATMPGPHNDPAKPAGTWCSRTRWHRIDFVAVPQEWFAAVKRVEVETAVALPGSGTVDHLVILPSRAGHECSRSIDASRAAPQRPEVREQIKQFWYDGPPVLSGFSVDEHADLWQRQGGRPGGAQRLGGKPRRKLN